MLELRTLGGLFLADEVGRPLGGPAAQRSRLAILAVIAVSGDRGISRDRLLALFWSESDDLRARRALNQAFYALRRVAGELTVGTTELRLNPGVVSSDVGRFETALAAGRTEDAARIYAGPFLDGIHLRRVMEFGLWLDDERRRLERAYHGALEQLARSAAAGGDHGAACAWWRKLALADPLSGRVALGLMDALATAGDREAAIRHAELHAARVRAELEVDPDPEIMERERAMRAAARPDPERLAKSPPRRAASPESAEPQPVLAVPAPRRPRRVAGIALALVAGAAFVAWAALGSQSSHQAADPVGDTTVVVFPFRVEGSADDAYLGSAMVELLSQAVDGSERLRGADARAVRALIDERGPPADPAAAVPLAGHLGGELFVLGTVVVRGDELRLAGALYERRRPGTPVATASVDGAAGDPFDAIDRFAGQLLAARWPAVRRPLTQAAAITAQLPALKAFLDAEHALREENMQRAVAEYTRAIHEDSTFALAYLRLATIARFNNILPRPDTLLERAQRFAHTLPTRYRSALDAMTAWETGDPDADRKLLLHVQHYPDDADGWFALGDMLLHANPLRGQPLADAERAIDRAVALDSTHRPALIHHFELKMRAGRFDEAGRALHFIRAPGRLEITWWIVDRIEAGGPDWMADIVERLEALDLEARRLGLIYAVSLTDHARAGARLWRWHLDHADVRATRLNGMQAMVWMDVLNGEASQAWTALRALEQEDAVGRLHIRILLSVLPWVRADSAELRTTLARYDALDLAEVFPDADARVAADRARDFQAAAILHRLGDHAAVDTRIERLRRFSGDTASDALGRELATVLQAWLASERRDLDAVRRQLAGFEPGPIRNGMGDAGMLERFLLAEAFERIGDPFNARRWYRSLLEDYTTFKTVAFRVPALIGEGRALDALGERDAARERYARAARLWREGDADARSVALDALKASSP